MNIHFLLNDENETNITSFYDMQSNPFQIGDVIFLSVEELFPQDLEKYDDEKMRKMVHKEQKTLRKKFHHNKIKIIDQNKSIAIESTRNSQLSIEYICEFSEEK